MPASFKLTAPAKINLFLHITGKTADHYHALQSLKIFADIGDEIAVRPAGHYNLTIDGTYALPADKNNLVTKAVMALSNELNKKPDIAIHLTKNIPFGAGLGGGSSDAATIIKALLQFWQTDLPPDRLNPILADLGSDVPACYLGQLCFAEGRGEILMPIALPSPLAAVLVYPSQKNDTTAIFKKYDQKFSAPISPPAAFEKEDDLITFIENKHNDLTAAAIEHTPVISNVLQSLAEAPTCLLARMSGSGSACFGLFKTPENAQKAAHDLAHKHPEWWVQSCLLA